MDLAMFSQIAEITDCLYLSSAAAVTGDKIRQLGITSIINVTNDIPNFKMHNVECVQIKVDDIPSAHLGVYFDRAADKINQVARQRGKTLVHCVAGISRSSSLCIAYLMKYQGMPLDQAYRHCKRCRSVVYPNIGFFKQLVDFERRLFGRNTVEMVPTNIGPVPDIYLPTASRSSRGPSSSSTTAGGGYYQSGSPRARVMSMPAAGGGGGGHSSQYSSTYGRDYGTTYASSYGRDYGKEYGNHHSNPHGSYKGY